MSSSIQISTNNSLITGWKTASINRSMEELCGSFDLTLVDKEGTASREISAGADIQVFVVDPALGFRDKLITGYIDEVTLSVSADSTNMTVRGRDKTSDLYDCSAITNANTFWNSKFSKIIETILEPFGLELDASELVDDPKIPKFTLQNGESAFESIERLCRSEGVLPLTNEDSTLVLTYATETVLADQNLAMPGNIKMLEQIDSVEDRFSEYIVRGQRGGGGKRWTKDQTRLWGRAEDEDISRYRPKVIISERRANFKQVQLRAAWEAQVRAGRGITHSVLVRDWYQKDINGKPIRPWAYNELIKLRSDKMGINSQRLITAVDLRIDAAGGRTTALTLKDPIIFKKNPSEKVKLT